MKNPSVVVTPKIVGKFECDLTIEDRPIPDIGEDEVLLEMASVGICGSGKRKLKKNNPRKNIKNIVQKK